MNEPHSPYLVAFVAGNMAFAKNTWRNKEVSLLLPHKFEFMKNEILKNKRNVRILF